MRNVALAIIAVSAIVLSSCRRDVEIQGTNLAVRFPCPPAPSGQVRDSEAGPIYTFEAGCTSGRATFVAFAIDAPLNIVADRDVAEKAFRKPTFRSGLALVTLDPMGVGNYPGWEAYFSGGGLRGRGQLIIPRGHIVMLFAAWPERDTSASTLADSFFRSLRRKRAA